jgi:Fe-S-cluster containining protein
MSAQEKIEQLFEKTVDLLPKNAINAIRTITFKIYKLYKDKELDFNTIISYMEKLMDLSLKSGTTEAEVALSIALDEMKQTKEYTARLNKYCDLSKIEPYFSKVPTSNFNFNLLLASVYEAQGSLREALIYYEDALYAARLNQEYQSELYTFNCLGRLLTETANFDNARSFYYLVFYNRTRKLDFTCQLTGKCCSDFEVNISTRDLLRILEHRPSLKPADFVLPTNEKILQSFGSDKEDDLFGSFHQELFYLKKKPDSKECIFLVDNSCSIHDYKPLTCRNWPMDVENDRIVFSHSKYLKDVCGYCITPDQNNREDLVKSNLREHNFAFNIQRLISNRFENNFAGTDITSEKIMEFALATGKNIELLLTAMKDLIISFEGVVKIVASFNKIDLEDQIPLVIYCEQNPDEVLAGLYDSFKNIGFENVAKINVGSTFLLRLEINTDITFFIVSLPLKELTGDTSRDEFILYEKENFPFPKTKIPVSVPQDQEAYQYVFKAVRAVTKNELLKNDLKKAKIAFEKLIYLYKKTDPENSELIYLVLDEIFYLHKFYFLRLKKELGENACLTALLEFENKIINDFIPDSYYNQLIFEFGKNLVISGLPQKANYYFNYLLSRIHSSQIKNEYRAKIAALLNKGEEG